MTILRILGSAALILTLITGIWFVDDRYVNAKDLNNLKEQIYLRIDTNEYRELTKQYYELKKLVRENPDSEELKEQLKEIKKEREELKKRIDDKLE
jgi:DNA repair exonuclease SbcCD ATPase subunit